MGNNINVIRKINISQKARTVLLILICTITTTSCTDRFCSAYARSSDRVSYKESLYRSRFGAQDPLSPYTEKHKAYLHRKYFGRR